MIYHFANLTYGAFINFEYILHIVLVLLLLTLNMYLPVGIYITNTEKIPNMTLPLQWLDLWLHQQQGVAIWKFSHFLK